MNLIQNVKVKVFLQNSIFPIFNWINKILPHKQDLVLLYINTDLRDNNQKLLDYLIDNKYNDRYKIICSCNNPKKYQRQQIYNVFFVSRIDGVLAFFRAGRVFYTIGKIPIVPSNDQKVMQMWHGIPLKGANEGWKKNHTWKRQHYTYLLSPSKHMAPVFSSLFSIPEDKIFIGGYPRCDVFFENNDCYDFGCYDKLVLWTPTFRKSNDTGMKELNSCMTVVPVLNHDDYEEINSFLKSINAKLVIKLHPMQDITNFQFKNMEYFKLLTHEEFVSQGMDLYRLAAQSDALITDYSSIYFDYLLLDRPIAFTEDDIDEYQKGRGFAVENPDSYKPGFRIKTKDELKQFIRMVVEDKDEYKEERKRVNDMVNDYRSGNFCKRILDVMDIKY